jgi:hypothetical protein
MEFVNRVKVGNNRVKEDDPVNGLVVMYLMQAGGISESNEGLTIRVRRWIVDLCC